MNVKQKKVKHVKRFFVSVLSAKVQPTGHHSTLFTKGTHENQVCIKCSATANLQDKFFVVV